MAKTFYVSTYEIGKGFTNKDFPWTFSNLKAAKKFCKAHYPRNCIIQLSIYDNHKFTIVAVRPLNHKNFKNMPEYY